LSNLNHQADLTLRKQITAFVGATSLSTSSSSDTKTSSSVEKGQLANLLNKVRTDILSELKDSSTPLAQRVLAVSAHEGDDVGSKTSASKSGTDTTTTSSSSSSSSPTSTPSPLTSQLSIIVREFHLRCSKLKLFSL